MSESEHVFMVRYTVYISADFGPEPITTVAGPFADRETAQYWIDNNESEYVTNLHGYPNPSIQKHPIRELEDLR